jgi:hypothetical protein
MLIPGDIIEQEEEEIIAKIMEQEDESSSDSSSSDSSDSSSSDSSDEEIVEEPIKRDHETLGKDMHAANPALSKNKKKQVGKTLIYIFRLHR